MQKTFYVTGVAEWAKLFESNRDMNEDFHGPGGAYTIQLYMEQDQQEIFDDSGSRIKPKVKDAGLCVQFKRKHIGPKDKKGEHIETLSGPPQVVDENNEPWDESVLIMNGSKVEVCFEVYSTSMGNGTRLMGVKILELAEMEDRGLPFG